MKPGFPLTPRITLKLVLLTAVAALPARALDEERLWLPKSYQKLYLELKDAALAAESLNRCVSVLDATIDLGQSTESRPIFRVQCRQQNGQTYNEMVDGVTNETLTTSKAVDAGPTPEELEQIRLTEERRKREQKQARIEKLWADCLAAFAEKSRLMINVRGPGSDYLPKPRSYAEDEVVFGFDFEAEDIAGAQLKLQAVCEADDERVLKMEFGRQVEE